MRNRDSKRIRIGESLRGVVPGSSCGRNTSEFGRGAICDSNVEFSSLSAAGERSRSLIRGESRAGRCFKCGQEDSAIRIG